MGFCQLIPYTFQCWIKESKQDKNYLEGLIYLDDALVSGKSLVECASRRPGVLKESISNIAL